jgi:hypothetical protein
MSIRTVMLIVAAAYFAFSVVYLVFFGLEEPRNAVWIGLIGIVVMAAAMAVRGWKPKD